MVRALRILVAHQKRGPARRSAGCRPTATTRSAGNSKVNSLPTPSALSTVSAPPISTAFSRHSARPRPRPAWPEFSWSRPRLKRSKMRVAILRRDAGTGVRHGELDRRVRPDAIGNRRGADLHLAAGGELDGVADQVEQHLAQPGRIDQPVTAQQIIVARLQLQPLVARLRLQRLGDLLHQADHIDFVDLQAGAADLAAGDLQQAVQHREQRLAACPDALQPMRCSCSSSLSSSSEQMPMIEFIGVRTSWPSAASTRSRSRATVAASSCAAWLAADAASSRCRQTDLVGHIAADAGVAAVGQWLDAQPMHTVLAICRWLSSPGCCPAASAPPWPRRPHAAAPIQVPSATAGRRPRAADRDDSHAPP